MPRQSKISWREDLKRQPSLFSPNFQKSLRRDFEVSKDGIEFLSSRLKGILILGRPPYLSVLPAIFESSEGERILEKATEDMIRSQKILQKSERLVADLKFLNGNGVDSLEIRSHLDNRFSEAIRQIQLLIIYMKLLKESNTYTLILPGAIGENRRSTGLAPHEKRELFVKTCLDCRHREGLHIGYSSSGNERGGQTIRFVQSVFSELATQDSVLPPSTIREDIRTWRNERATMDRLEKILKNQ